MHPVKPELDGKDVSSVADPTGKLLFVEFVKTVEAQEHGFVDYLWPRPGQEKPQPKIAYVKGFAPWGWIVGSGVYLDDVNEYFRVYATKLVTWILVMSAFMLVFTLLIIRSINNPCVICSVP